MKAKKIVADGNSAAAYAVRLARAQVIAAYPITPQTSIIEKIAEFIAKGNMNAEFIQVESEHSAMSACIGASATGTRVFTATSSQGLLFMHEMLHWASGSRLPIVMAEVNRAVAPPWSIWADHHDSISQRDTGWIQLYCENNQDILDTILQGYKIAEDSRVLLPVMVCYDGFELSHTAMPIELPAQKDVDAFLGPFDVDSALVDFRKPQTHGNAVSPDLYMEFRFLIQEAMENAKVVIEETALDFKRRFGRSQGSQVQCYKCRDVDVVIISMGGVSSEAKEAVDRLRDEKLRVGAVKVRSFRPFPKEAIQEIGRRVKAFVVFDRDVSFGFEGALFTEVKSALYELDEKPFVLGFIAGLGGRDIRVRNLTKGIRKAFNALINDEKFPEEEWVALKEQ